MLQLKRSLYGMKNSPLYWFSTVKKTITSPTMGFVQSKEDQCLFYNAKTRSIILLYVDDCLMFSHSERELDTIIAQLRKHHDLDEQQLSRDVYAYLGIELDLTGDGVELLQNGLTEKILRTVGMLDCSPNETPAKEEFLPPDTDGEGFNEAWDYRSVLGMLMYLVHTHPDIQFAVHQCAKFAHCPRQRHANAIKKICRYLSGTRNRGIRFRKTLIDPQDLQINCYVDASFAPCWKHKGEDNNATSQTGYVIKIDDVPIAWSSKKQSLTALSTTESEYIALSQAMRELLWVRRLVEDVATGFGISYNRKTVIKSTVFEDNEGAIALSKRPDMTPRTRHLHTKYHQFKENLGLDQDGNGIVVKWISTEEQIADIFTKGVGPNLFVPLRNVLMGWKEKNSNKSSPDKSEISGVRKGELEKSSKTARKGATNSDVTGDTRDVTPTRTAKSAKSAFSQNGEDSKTSNWV